jgi:hypothetical protein
VLLGEGESEVPSLEDALVEVPQRHDPVVVLVELLERLGHLTNRSTPGQRSGGCDPRASCPLGDIRPSLHVTVRQKVYSSDLRYTEGLFI